MRGGMKFQDALTIRLNAIQPTVDIVEKFIVCKPPKLTPVIQELVHLLHQQQTSVYLISGGFTSIVQPVANILQIPMENIFCNKLKFYYNGNYAGFDEQQPTSHSGGKGEVIQLLKHKFHYQRLVMIGDGATDLEACPPADGFIGFGGNHVREEVRKQAKWFVMDFQELIDELTQ